MAQAAAGVAALLSMIPDVLHGAAERAVSSRSLLNLAGGPGITAEEEEDLMRYILKSLTPAFIGGALAVIVMVAYFLFALVSCCCKICCSSKRGFCQRPQQIPYKQRLPFILMVALPAILGLIGGIMVLSGGPGLVKALQGLINGLLVEFNDLIDMLQSLHDDGLRAQQLAGIEDAGMGELGSINQELTSFRDDGLAQFNEQSAMLFGIVSKISMIIGGGLMATGVLGIIGPATLKNFLMVGFLIHAAVLSAMPFAVWGVLTVTANVTNDICVGIDLAIIGQEGDSELPITIPCPDADESFESLNSLYEYINEGMEGANSHMADANTGAAAAFRLLQDECSAFNGPGATYYDALCSIGSSVDAQLMSSIYECADPENEGIAAFSIQGALELTDTSCAWHSANYPAVTIPGVQACFRTATQTINSNDGQFRGIVHAASLEGATLLNNDDFVRDVLMILPLACAFDTGTASMQFTSTAPPVLPPLCPPFRFTGGGAAGPVVATATSLEQCQQVGQIAMANFAPTFQRFKCPANVETAAGANASEDAKRRHCTIARSPLFQEEYTNMADAVEGVTILQGMLPSINALLDCSVLIDVMVTISTNCHPIVKAARSLATGMLLCGIGFALAGLFICSCWRKLNKPKNSIEPYNEFK